MATALKLTAFSEDDLQVLSALVQDAVFQHSWAEYDAGAKRFVVMLNRFRWEARPGFWARLLGKARPGRTLSALQFNTVQAVRTLGLTDIDGTAAAGATAQAGSTDASFAEAVGTAAPQESVMPYNLLALHVSNGTGCVRIRLILSGGAAIELEAEAVDVILSDQSVLQTAAATPRHT